MSLSKAADPKSTLIISEKVLNLLIPGISGALAGCLSTAILYPIENVKTRMQALAKAEKDTTIDLEAGKSKKQKKAFELVAEILEKEGVQGFYKGMHPYLLATLSTFGVYFFWYELLKPIFIKDQFSLLGYTKTALFASSITTTVTNPFWVLHTRILLEKGKNLGLSEAVMNILKKEGLGGFYKGIEAGYILVLNPISQFIIYEFLKKTFENTKYKSAMIFLAGAISKAIATFLTYPLQTLKTNLQANKHRKVNILQILREIFERRGLKGFYAGLNAKLSQTVINSALVLVIYERVQEIVKKVLVAVLSKKI